MAAEIEPTANEIEKKSKVRGAVMPRRSARRTAAGSVVKPLRSIAIFGAVGALVAAVALPGFAASARPTDAQATTTLQQVAVDDAQSLVVASEATAAPMNRGTYAATTPEEIAKKKAEEAAAARAKAAAQAAAASSNSNIDTDGIALVAPGSGAVRYPVTPGSYSVSRTLTSYHNGADMAGKQGTPIYAAAAGTVRISSESHFGYGVAIVIDHVIGGQRVSTLYGHMVYGSRQVSVGDTVEAGQLIGLMGNTGRSFGSHLHFEVRVNGGLVEPIGWLAANAG